MEQTSVPLFIRKPERMVWCDIVRLLAFFFLLCCHAADPFYAAATYASSGSSIDPELISWGTRWGSLVRPCVPLFVMLTGVLTLPVRDTMTGFYRRRIPRVLIPFLIWSAVYYMTPWLTGVLGMDSSIVYRLFSWAESDSQSFGDAVVNVARIPYTFSFIACHMWYIYMLVGMYLYLPVFSAWVERASKKEQELFLALWALSTLLPYFGEYISRYSFGTCEWNSFGLFYYFSGFSGYMLLGHYIHRHATLSFRRALCISIPMLLAGYGITLYGYSHIMSLPDKTPEQMELFWTYCTPNVLTMTVAWFLPLSRIRISPQRRVASWLSNLTVCGFGIYMIHYFFVFLGYDIGAQLHIIAPLRIPFSAIVILVCSWCVVAALRRLLGPRAVYLLG